MRFATFFPVLVLPLAWAAALQPRLTTASTILSDLKAMDQAVLKFTSSLNGFTGGLLAPVQLTLITANFGALHLAIQKATLDSLLITKTFSLADSNAIVGFLRENLMVNDPEASRITIAKKPLFDQALLTAVVKMNSGILLADHWALDKALFRWLDKSVQPEAERIAKVTTKALEDSIAAYS